MYLFGCSKPDESTLRGCCENPPINAQVGNGHIYVPNIFTPNGDHINDQLIISTDSIRFVTSLKIINNLNRIVFEMSDFSPNGWVSVWNGTVDGKVREGIYFISLKVVSEDNTFLSLNGKVCNYACSNPATLNIEKPKITSCTFGTQSMNGYYIPGIQPDPNPCFE